MNKYLEILLIKYIDLGNICWNKRMAEGSRWDKSCDSEIWTEVLRSK